MKKKSPGFWLAVALILCVVSMVGASLVQTGGGNVTVKDLRWETPSGKLMSALLFVPDSATKDAPAPAVVTSHGWYNNREMQDLNYVELARRGYVVMSIDMYGHGNSDFLVNADLAIRATGMTDAVELIASLPYVDKTRIGVTGHSNGARAANFAIDDDNLKDEPLIKAVLLVANDATYADKDGKFINKYGSRDAGIVAALYDEFFFRVKDANGVASAPKDYINQKTAQSFLNYGIDPAQGEKREAYQLYTQTIDGEEAIRVIYNPNQIHPWNHFSATVVRDYLDFFQASLGAPNPIPSSNQVWQWKVFFNTLGLFGFVIFLYNITLVLLRTKYFSPLLATEPVVAMPAPTGSSRAWLWISLVLGQVFAGVSYLAIFITVNKIRPPFFNQSPVFYIGSWATLVGLFTLLLIVIGWYFFGGKKSGINLKQRGVVMSWSKVWKTILLSLAVVGLSYSIVFLADWLFKTDFRIWVLPLKAFSARMLPVALKYLPMLAIFYVLNSVAINSFNYVKMGSKPWVNLAVLALFNVLNALVIVIVQYGVFFATGKSWTETALTPPVSNIVGIWLFPLLVYFPLAAVLDRKLYQYTRNPYLGGLILAILLTIISCVNTLTFVY